MFCIWYLYFSGPCSSTRFAPNLGAPLRKPCPYPSSFFFFVILQYFAAALRKEIHNRKCTFGVNGKSSANFLDELVLNEVGNLFYVDTQSSRQGARDRGKLHAHMRIDVVWIRLTTLMLEKKRHRQRSNAGEATRGSLSEDP